MRGFQGITVDVKIWVCHNEQFVIWLHSICHFYSLKKTKVLKKRGFCQIVQLKVSSSKDSFLGKFDFVCLGEELKPCYASSFKKKCWIYLLWRISAVCRIHTILVLRAFSGASRRSQNSCIIFILSVISVAPSPSPNTSKMAQKTIISNQQERKPSLKNCITWKDYLAQMQDQMLGTQFPVKGFSWITNNNVFCRSI